MREKATEATAHAEMFAIQQACQAIESWALRTNAAICYIRPCPMCSGAMMLARVEEVYFGAYDPKAVLPVLLLNLLEDERFNHWSYVEGGILERSVRAKC